MKNQKFIIVFILVASVFSINIFAQEKNEENYQVKYRRYGFGLGYNPILLFFDFKDINSQLKKVKMDELSGNNLLNHSGVLYFYTGFFPNFRIGGIWSLGEKGCERKCLCHDKNYDFNLDFWAISFDYICPIAKQTSAVFGCFIGKGDIQQTFSQSSSEPGTWESFWEEFQIGYFLNDYKLSLKSSFFIFSPHISIDYGINDFITLMAGTGYLGSIKSKTKLEDFHEINNVPSTLQLKNFYINIGLQVCIFMD
jgi:hypothetical protein